MSSTTVPFFIKFISTSYSPPPSPQFIFINSAPSMVKPDLTVIRQDHPAFGDAVRSMADESVLHVYKTVFYNIPVQVKPSQSIFYVTCGTHIGVMAGWENALHCVLGVTGGRYYDVDSITTGEEKVRAAIDEGRAEIMEPWAFTE
ncbi:hypothetical protein EV702DRAFT_1042308 [Suillus placidus]|uniref:Uncharacterized protein n=1 Tax=Suillus placidus TaxID=48579 RepID=A0A9P7A309_9AGAM|nr:hypothetical protein EV702DRAFT_1042308 [Suillus placidus]